MRVRALSPTGDWLFGQGFNDYKVNAAAVGQNIQTRLNAWLGDCFFDTGAGLNWALFLGSKDQLALNLAVSATIINTPYVASLVQLSINLNPQTRALSIVYTVTTTFGQVITGTLTNTATLNLLTESGLILLTEGGDPIVLE